MALYGSRRYTQEERETAFWEKVEKTDGCWPYDCWLWMGALSAGYGVIGRGGSGNGHMGAHVFSWTLAHGRIPADLGKAFDIDHMTTCPKNCVNPDHLVAVPHKRNQENRAGPQRNNTSGFRGVTWDKRRKKWQAGVMHYRKYHFAGYWNTAEEAAAAVQRKREELGFHEH